MSTTASANNRSIIITICTIQNLADNDKYYVEVQCIGAESTSPSSASGNGPSNNQWSRTTKNRIASMENFNEKFSFDFFRKKSSTHHSSSSSSSSGIFSKKFSWRKSSSTSSSSGSNDISELEGDQQDANRSGGSGILLVLNLKSAVDEKCVGEAVLNDVQKMDLNKEKEFKLDFLTPNTSQLLTTFDVSEQRDCAVQIVIKVTLADLGTEKGSKAQKELNVVRQGFMYKRGNKGRPRKKRWFELEDNLVLSYFRNRNKDRLGFLVMDDLTTVHMVDTREEEERLINYVELRKEKQKKSLIHLDIRRVMAVLYNNQRLMQWNENGGIEAADEGDNGTDNSISSSAQDVWRVGEDTDTASRSEDTGYKLQVTPTMSFNRETQFQNRTYDFKMEKESECRDWCCSIADMILVRKQEEKVRRRRKQGLPVLQYLRNYEPFIKYLKDEDPFLVLSALNQIHLPLVDDLVLPLMVIYDTCLEGSGKTCLDLCFAAIDIELKNCHDPGTLFRRTSIASKLLTLFLKVQGGTYARTLLFSLLHDLCVTNEHDINFEIDTDRLKDARMQYVNGAQLAETTDQVCSLVMSDHSIRICPHNIRRLFFYLYHRTEEKFPGAGEISVGSLLFLRFINPLILSPHLEPIHEPILPRSPSEQVQRNLTLLTKVLQNIVNQVKTFGPKEAFMSNSERVIECTTRRQEHAKEFLFQMANLDDVRPSRSYKIQDDMKNRALRLVHNKLYKSYAKNLFTENPCELPEATACFHQMLKTLKIDEKLNPVTGIRKNWSIRRLYVDNGNNNNKNMSTNTNDAKPADSPVQETG